MEESTLLWFFNRIYDIYSTVNNGLSISFYGLSIGIIDIMLTFILISMVVTVFWKGAKG